MFLIFFFRCDKLTTKCEIQFKHKKSNNDTDWFTIGYEVVNIQDGSSFGQAPLELDFKCQVYFNGTKEKVNSVINGSEIISTLINFQRAFMFILKLIYSSWNIL